MTAGPAGRWLKARATLGLTLAIVAIAFYFDKIHPSLVHQDIGSIDKIIVHKQQRTMAVYEQGKLIKSYPISLGADPIGHKSQEGDGKTPEGNYAIDWVHPDSSYHKAVRISYPNAADRQNAKQAGVTPGGDIMIHGMPNGFGWLYPILAKIDWTQGCIAVSNTAMEEIELAVKVGTAITIEP